MRPERDTLFTSLPISALIAGSSHRVGYPAQTDNLPPELFRTAMENTGLDSRSSRNLFRGTDPSSASSTTFAPALHIPLIAAARPTTDPLLHDLHRPHTSADFHRSAILPHRTTKTPAESSFTRKRNAPARTLTANRHLVEQLCEDDHLLAEFVTGLITRAQGNGQRVRAFGEMVALLWAQGDIAATIRLERLGTRCVRARTSRYCVPTRKRAVRWTLQNRSPKSMPRTRESFDLADFHLASRNLLKNVQEPSSWKIGSHQNARRTARMTPVRV
jgi:hypothetical protein